MAQRGEEPTNPSDLGVVCRAAAELLRAGHVAQAADALSRAQTLSAQAGDQVLAHVLAMVCRTCLAYTQCRLEVDWYRRMYEQAAQREQEVLRGLGDMLDLIASHQTQAALAALPVLPETTLFLEPFAPNNVRRDGFWQRVKGLFGQRTRSPGPAINGPVYPPDEPTPSSPDLQPPQIAQSLPAASRQQPSNERPHLGAVQGTSAVAPCGADPLHALAANPVTDTEDTSQHSTLSPVAAELRGHSAPSLTIYGLGPFRVYRDDRPIEDWTSLKARSIFKYLVVHRETPVLKDILMDRFWPDADPQAARRNLHQAVYSLRCTLRQGQSYSGHIRFENDCYSLDPELDLWVDWEEFESSVEAGHRLETAGRTEEAMHQYGIAESLYQGDFLEEDVYEDWTHAVLERLRGIYCDTARRLSEYHLYKKEYHAAITLCQKILARDNCCEQAHRCVMRCYLAQRQRHLAVRQYQVCAAVLREELDLTPSEETVALYQRITTGL